MSALPGLELTAHPLGLVLPVRAQPGAARERVVGVHGNALKIAVAAAPERGKANDAIRALLARVLAVAKHQVALLSGATARDKRFLVQGLAPDVLRLRLVEAMR